MKLDTQIKETVRVLLEDDTWFAHEALILGNQLAIMKALKEIESRLPSKPTFECGPP